MKLTKAKEVIVINVSKTKSKKSDRWVIASKKDIEEARKKGLYKCFSSMTAKKQFYLSPTHISDIVYLVADAIEQQVLKWHESGGETNTEEENPHLFKIESLLYILEDLFPHHFAIHSITGNKHLKGKYTIGDGMVFQILGLVRKIVAFPPQVEKFYVDYEAKDAEYYRQSSVCLVCGGKQARLHYENAVVHEDCVVKHGWYTCDWCGWLYPNNKKRCSRKEQCSEKELVKCKLGDDEIF